MAVSQETKRDYSRRGYGIRLGWGKRPALVVIDFQRCLTDESYQYGHNYDDEIAATAELLSEARRARIPIAHTVIGYTPGTLDAGIMLIKIPGMKDFIFGSEATEFDARVAPTAGELIIEKTTQSAFFGTPFNTYLTMRSVDTLIVAGCTASGCVRATVTDASAYGYRPMVVAEAVGDIADEPRDGSFFDMESKVADVVTLAETLDELRSVAALGRADEAIAARG
jgi:maleamate amidohydrolase